MDEKQFVFILLTDELRAARRYDWSIPHEYESGRDHLFQTFVEKYQPLADYTFCAQDDGGVIWVVYIVEAMFGGSSITATASPTGKVPEPPKKW